MNDELPIFDSHFHIIDSRFPLHSNQSYLPPEFTCEDYLNRTSHLSIAGGALVSGSFQEFDQTYLQDALKKLGPSFVGVAQLPSSVSDDEILELDKLGVRGIRFNLKRKEVDQKEIEGFAKRVYEIARWHCEFYIDSSELFPLVNILLELPEVSIDHLGLSKEGLPILLSLVENGIKVKATGFGRVDFEISDILKQIADINPEALMFGTDLPSTRAKRPFSDKDIQLILETFDPNLSRKILYSNAIEFYRPKQIKEMI